MVDILLTFCVSKFSYNLHLGLPALEHLLTPRYRGSFLALSVMRERMNAVYDLTFAYGDCIHVEEDGSVSPKTAPQMTGWW